MAQMGLRDESLRGSHRSGAVNGHDECRKQHGRFEQRSNDWTEKGQECAVVLRREHVVHGKGSGSHQRTLDARSVGVSVTHERCGEQSGDDGTEDQRVREIRNHRNSGTPAEWHRHASSRRRTDEDASHHELAQVGNIPGHQDGSDECKASPECDGKIGRRNGRGRLHERIQGCFQRFWKEAGLRGRVLVSRAESPSSFRLSQEAGCIEMASIDFNALEIGAVQLPEGHRIRTEIDACAAVTVLQKSVADDYPMLHTPGKAKSYRPASGKLLPDLSV